MSGTIIVKPTTDARGNKRNLFYRYTCEGRFIYSDRPGRAALLPPGHAELVARQLTAMQGGGQLTSCAYTSRANAKVR